MMNYIERKKEREGEYKEKMGGRGEMITIARHVTHRCQLSRNVRDNPEIGGPVPCPAQNLIFGFKFPGISI